MPRHNQCQTRRRKNRRIGEGQFGYVISPAIPCIGRNVSRKVSKLFKKQENLHKNFKSKYKNFATRRVRLQPVIEKLRELDPDQTHFLYPEFCDTPGELTNELRANGVTNESKHESYLMSRGGIPFKRFIEPLIELVNAALREDSTKGFMPSARRKEILDKIYAVMHPLVKQADTLLKQLHDAKIFHGDLHQGNILLMPKSSSAAEAFANIITAVSDVKRSPSYLEYIRPLGFKNQFFSIYPMTAEQIESTYALVDALAAAKPFETIDIQIIDWDSAEIDEDLSKDDMRDERYNYLSMFFPQNHGMRYDFLDKYYDES